LRLQISNCLRNPTPGAAQLGLMIVGERNFNPCHRFRSAHSNPQE